MSDSPYLNRSEAAIYVRATVKAFDHWVRARGVPCVRRGRIRLFRRDVLDRILASGATPTTQRRMRQAGWKSGARSRRSAQKRLPA